MGLYKICTHKGRARDRCDHAWWGSFRGKRVSLAKWTNREITSKAEADKALDELTAAIRDGTFDERGLDPPPDNSPMTFGTLAETCRHIGGQARVVAGRVAPFLVHEPLRHDREFSKALAVRIRAISLDLPVVAQELATAVAAAGDGLPARNDPEVHLRSPESTASYGGHPSLTVT